MHNIVILGTAHPHIFGLADIARGAKGCQLVGVYDEDPARLAVAVQKLGLPGTGNLEEAISWKPSLTLIAGVPCDRANLAVRSLEAGAAAIVDKPLAVTHEALARIQGAVSRYKKPVFLYLPYRGTPQLLAAKAAVDAGRIGKLVRIYSTGPHKLNAPNRPSWHWTTENGGILIDTGSHHIDICCWFAGGKPSHIHAVHANHSQPDHPDFQDYGHAQLTFPNGVIGNAEVDWLNPAKMNSFGDVRMWFQGTLGKIELHFGDTNQHRIWTPTDNGAPLDVSGFPPESTWATRAMEDLAGGGPGPIPQDDFWTATQATLDAFRTAKDKEDGIPY